MRATVRFLIVALALSSPAGAGTLRQDPKPESPVSIERIKRGLEQPAPKTTLDAYRLSYYVSVIATAPPVNIFKDFDATGPGPVAGSIVSHQDMISFITPKEFSSPPADLLGTAIWVSTKLAKKIKENHDQ